MFKAAREKVKDSPNYAFFLPIVTKDTDMVDTEEHQKLVSEEEYNDAKGTHRPITKILMYPYSLTAKTCSKVLLHVLREI